MPHDRTDIIICEAASKYVTSDQAVLPEVSMSIK